MKKVGLKINHYKQEENYRFVIMTENEEVETFPQEVKVSSFWVYDGRTDYLFDVLYEEGKREFYLEDESSQSVFYLEEMANAESWKYRHEGIMYKKSDNWYIFCHGSGDKLLGKEVMPDELYVSEYKQDNQNRYHITKLGVRSFGFELECDSYLTAEDDHGRRIFLAHELETEPDIYVWLDGEKSRNCYDSIEFCYVEGKRCLWHSNTKKLEEVKDTSEDYI